METKKLSAEPNSVKTVAKTVRFRARDPFQQYVRTRVERHLRMIGRQRHGGARFMFKSATIMTWIITSYIVLVFFAHSWPVAIIAALNLGLAAAGVGFNIQHDAGHRAISKNKHVNWLMALSLDLMGGSSYLWDIKHNKLHHTYTNIDGHDDDIDLGFLARFAPTQKYYWFHRYQHIYMWFLYTLVILKWHIIDDYRDVLLAKIGDHPIDRPKGKDLIGFVSGKVAFSFFAFILPMFLHNPLVVLFWYVVSMGIGGLVMSVVFQLAHVVEDAAYPLPNPETGNMEEAWAIHQMRTTVDFAQKSKVLTWYLGGLNFQAEHHILANVSHLHYPRIAKLVASACKRYNVPYNVHPTFWDGLVSHARQLRALGQPTPA